MKELEKEKKKGHGFDVGLGWQTHPELVPKSSVNIDFLRRKS